MAAYSLESSNVFSYTFPSISFTSSNYLIIDATDYQSLNLNATPWTIEFWVKHNNNATDRVILGSRVGTSSSAAYYIYYSSSGTLIFFNGTNFDTGDKSVANAWSHVAFVNNLSSFNVYVNGTTVYNSANTSLLGTRWYDNANYTIGARSDGAAPFSGQLSNLRVIKGQAIYNGDFEISTFPIELANNSIGPAGGSNVAASLTGNVVLLTCASDNFTDYGNTSFRLREVGSVFPRVIPTSQLESFSYHFGDGDANGTCLVTSASNSLNLNNNFTIETWIYPTQTGGTIVNRAGGPNNAIASYWIGWDGANLNFAASSTNTGYNIGSITGTAGYIGTPTLNAWNHIAVTRSGNEYRGFLNGNLNYSETSANTPYGPPGTKTLAIGGEFQNGQTWGAGIPANNINGYLSYLRIFRGTALYTSAFTPPQSPLGLKPNTVLLTAASPGDDTTGSTTGNYEDLSRTVTISSNGMSNIRWSTFSPFKANAVSNANSTTVAVTNITTGIRNYKIIDKIDYTKFATPFVHNYTIGCRLGKIIDKVDYTKFANPDITAYTIGNRLGKIISAVVIPIKYAYIPTNTRSYDPTQYQFWS